jgi:hypothetical protein
MREIPGYEGLYAATESGEIWSLLTTRSRRKRALKPFVNTGGYLRLNLSKEGRPRKEYVHRLVARAFLPNPLGLGYVNHKDANPQNNSVNNLEWCDQRENIAFSRALGNQAKDIPVVALNILTGEVRQYKTLKDAGVELFDAHYILRYHWQKKGRVFTYRGWRFEVEL